MYKARNELMELQFIGALCFYPERIKEFPHLEKVIPRENKVAHAALSAIKDVGKPDAVAMAELMSRRYKVKITPDELQASVLALAHNYGEVNLDQQYSILCSLYETRTGMDIAADLGARIAAGEKPSVVAQDFLRRASEVERLQESRYESTDDWAIRQKKEAAEQRRTFASGKFLTLPSCWPGMKEKIQMIPRAILICLLARSGAGKTGVAQETAHHWADESGETVVYFCTELTSQQMRWRRACQGNLAINYSALERGDDEGNPELASRVERALSPCKNGGKVIYIEAEGMQLEEMIAIADKFSASIVIDYWDDIEIDNFRKGSANESQAIHKGLQYVKGYIQRTRRNALIVTQVGKEGDDADRLKGSHANQSMAFYKKSNLFLIMDGFTEVDEPTSVMHPFDTDDKGREYAIELNPGERLPIGTISASKNTFGKAGWSEPVFMWGGRFRTVSIPKEKRRFYSKYL